MLKIKLKGCYEHKNKHLPEQTAQYSLVTASWNNLKRNPNVTRSWYALL